MTRVRSIMARLRQELFLPVLMKEMRSRMRGARTPLLLLLTTAVVILVSAGIMVMRWDSLSGNQQQLMQALPELGRNLFNGLLVVEMGICALIAPALTAGAITTEREQQTFEMLLITRLSGYNIVLGKLLSSLSFVFIVVLCALPAMAMAFFLGGVSPQQIGGGITLIMATVLLFGAIGIFCSARNARTVTATVIAYLICIAWLGMVPLILIMLGWVIRVDFAVVSELVSFIVFTCLLACLAVLPAGCCYALMLAIRHRPLSRFQSLLLLFCWAIILAFMLMPYYIEQTSVSSLYELSDVMLGNPIIALSCLGIDIGYYYGGGSFTEQYFLLLTILIILIGAWTFVTLAVAKVEQARGRWAVTEAIAGRDISRPAIVDISL